MRVRAISQLKSLQLIAGFLKDVGAWMSGFALLSVVTSEFGDLDAQIVKYLTIGLCFFTASAILSLLAISMAAGWKNKHRDKNATTLDQPGFKLAWLLILLAAASSLVGLILILVCFIIALTKKSPT